MYNLSYFCFTAVILSVCIDDTSAPIHKKNKIIWRYFQPASMLWLSLRPD